MQGGVAVQVLGGHHVLDPGGAEEGGQAGQVIGEHGLVQGTGLTWVTHPQVMQDMIIENKYSDIWKWSVFSITGCPRQSGLRNCAVVSLFCDF